MSRTTLDTAAFSQTSNTRLSLSLVRLSKRLLLSFLLAFAVRTPKCTHFGLGSSAFDRLYLRNHGCFLFLRLLRCFSSPGSPRTPMNSVHGDRISPAGFPHSDIPGYNAYLRLTGAFRSLSRLSSALSARASALRPFLLNHFNSTFRF